jgi:hypothetical protein
MHREQHRIHRPLADHPYGIRHRIPVNHREAPVARRIHPKPLTGKQYGGDGGGREFGGGGHGILQAMVQEDGIQTSIRIQPETS